MKYNSLDRVYHHNDNCPYCKHKMKFHKQFGCGAKHCVCKITNPKFNKVLKWFMTLNIGRCIIKV